MIDVRSLAVVVFATLGFAVSCGPSAAEDDAEAKVRQSLVFLRASGIGKSGPALGQNLAAEATGFVVSSDGLVLTSYHLLTKIGDVDPDTLRIAANVSEKIAIPKFDDLRIAASEPLLDLLLLRLPTGPEPYKAVELGTATKIDTNTELRASGFAKDANYKLERGFLKTKDGPRGHLWTVSVHIAEGMSGGPVFDADGHIVAIAKGANENDPSDNYIVPIDFADPLLGNIRVAALLSRIGASDTGNLDERIRQLETDIAGIKRSFSWSAGFTEDGRPFVHYDKMIAGPPHVAKVKYKLDPQSRTAEGASKYFEDIPPDECQITQGGGQAMSGEFRLDSMKEALNAYRKLRHINIFDSIRIKFTPILDDGTPLSAVQLSIEDHNDSSP